MVHGNSGKSINIGASVQTIFICKSLEELLHKEFKKYLILKMQQFSIKMKKIFPNLALNKK